MLPVASGKGAAFDPNGHSANLAKIAFDALHGIARVVPIEADGGMIDSVVKQEDLWMPIPSGQQIWEAMSAAGDLTKRPETKP